MKMWTLNVYIALYQKRACLDDCNVEGEKKLVKSEHQEEDI